MKFQDNLTFHAEPKVLEDGRLLAFARVARSGVQVYRGLDLGDSERETVRVWRPEEEVFAIDAVRSYARVPITVGHPKDMVTAETWKQEAVGETGDEIVRDGDFIRVPLIVRDAAAVQSISRGLRELSMGYEAKVEFRKGITPSGQEYDAIQREMKMNHVALVERARGGKELRIGDENPEAKNWGAASLFYSHQKEPGMSGTRKIMVDGLAVETTDQGALAIEKLQKALADSASSLVERDAKFSEAAKAIEVKDGEIAALKKQLADAQMTPAKMAEAVKARTELLRDAARLLPSAPEELSTLPDAEVRRKVVAHVLGDSEAKNLSDEAVSGAFSALARSPASTDPFRDAVRSGLKAHDGAELWPNAVFKRAGVNLRKEG